ncbi:MAG: VOC family protein [Vicinamibacterales bacterium]
MPAAHALSRLHQIAQPIADIDRAVAFYRDVLGLPLLFTAPPNLAFFDCAGVRLMLSPPSPGHDHPGSVLYFAVDDIQAAHDALQARGAVFTGAPAKIATLADREVWLAGFTDSEGNALALMSEPRLG